MMKNNKRELVNIINDSYDISRFCDKCEIEKTQMVKHQERTEWLICPRCGWTVSMFAGQSRLVDDDASEPLLEIIDGGTDTSKDKKTIIEDRLIGELKKKGMSDIRVTRL